MGSIFRKKRYTEPPRVFVHLLMDGEDDVHLWIRNCPLAWCRRVCFGLQQLGVAVAVNWKKKYDLVQRDGHYKDYLDVQLFGVDVQDGGEILKIAVQSQFRMIQECEVVWVNAHRFLNMKVWHRK